MRWSRVEEGVNAYWFRGLRPGTNYSVCLALAGEACHVQVVFATKEKAALAAGDRGGRRVPPGAGHRAPAECAACCHLLAKHPGKPYRLILGRRPPTPWRSASPPTSTHAPPTSSPKSYPAGGEAGGEEPEGAPGEGLDEDMSRGTPLGTCREESLAACSLVESQSKANQEEFEAGSEYSDRLPLGAEAVDIAQEINGNYRQTAG